MHTPQLFLAALLALLFFACVPFLPVRAKAMVAARQAVLANTALVAGSPFLP